MSETSAPPRSRSGSQKRRAKHHIPGRLTDEELAAFQAEAEAAGITAAALGRFKALGAEPPRAARSVRSDELLLLQIRGQLGKIGGNVNQMAHKANAVNELPTLAALQALQRDIRAMTDMHADALGYDVIRQPRE